MKVKTKYCGNIGKFIYTYKFVRKNTNKLAEDDIIKINDIVRYYCDYGATIIENEELRRLVDENANLKKQIEDYEKK
jgi:hypothetical protein